MIIQAVHNTIEQLGFKEAGIDDVFLRLVILEDGDAIFDELMGFGAEGNDADFIALAIEFQERDGFGAVEMFVKKMFSFHGMDLGAAGAEPEAEVIDIELPGS